MSDAEGGGSLQFEKAEFDSEVAEGSSCARCGEALRQTYFVVDGAATCPVCRNGVATEGTGGSGPGRFARACLFGILAGAVGAAIWYGIREATGYEIGLISILVGIMVGVAVRAGSRGRGGLLYQALAVFLAYSAMVSTYVPPILGELRKLSAAEGEGASAGADTAGTGATREAAAPAEPAATASTGALEPEVLPGPAGEVSAGEATLGLAVLSVIVVALAYAAPFLGGVENIIGIAIIAFGLWEAWRINRRQEHSVSGPFRVGEATPPPASGGAVPGV